MPKRFKVTPTKNLAHFEINKKLGKEQCTNCLFIPKNKKEIKKHSCSGLAKYYLWETTHPKEVNILNDELSDTVAKLDKQEKDDLREAFDCKMKAGKRKLHVARADHRYRYIKCKCGFTTGSYYWKKTAETHYKAHLKHQTVKAEHIPTYRTCSAEEHAEDMRKMSEKIKSGRWRAEI